MDEREYDERIEQWEKLRELDNGIDTTDPESIREGLERHKEFLERGIKRLRRGKRNRPSGSAPGAHDGSEEE